MTNVNEHLSSSLSSETESLKDSDVSAVSRERVESETEPNCSIENSEGDESFNEDDEETKREEATEGEHSETGEEIEIADSDREDNLKAPCDGLRAETESSRVEESYPNVGGNMEDITSKAKELDSSVDDNEEEEASSVGHDQSSKLEDNSSNAEGNSSRVEKIVESSETEEESSKAESKNAENKENAETTSKAEEESSKAESKNAEIKENAETTSKAEEESSKAESKNAEIKENAETTSKAEEESLKAESKNAENKENAETTSKAEEESSKAESKNAEIKENAETTSKAEEESSKAESKNAEIKENTETTSKATEESTKAESKNAENKENTETMTSKATEESTKAESKNADIKEEAEMTSKAVEENLKIVSTNADVKENAVITNLKAEEESLVTVSKTAEIKENTETTTSKAAEDSSKAESKSPEIKETETRSSNAEENSSNVDKQSLEVEEIVEEIVEETSGAERHSSKTDEENSGGDAEYSRAENERLCAENQSLKVDISASNEGNPETEKNSVCEEKISCTEVEDENSEEETDEEEEAEDESSQATGTEQEEVSEDGENVEEEEEDDGSDKDAESSSGWDEKRHMGDGEEESEVKVEKKLDDDEDKANPAYIPRKGSFYEHDLRLEDVDDDDDDSKETNQQKASGKKLWVDDHKWLHDRYDARQQAPKTSQELADSYGFDIRRGKESDIPTRNSMPRTRRPGEKSRFGDYFRHQTSEEYSGDDGGGQDNNRTAPNHNRNRINTENRRYPGRREHFRNNDVTVGFAQSDFPALRENVDIVAKTNAGAAQPREDKSNEERNKRDFRKWSDRCDSRDDENEEDIETERRNRSDRRGGASERNNFRKGRDRHSSVDEENAEEFDNRRSRFNRRGKASESRGAPRFNRGRGRGRGGRWQRDRYEPEGRNRNWQEREETNEERPDRNDTESKNRNSYLESCVVEETPQRTVRNQESRQHADDEASHSGEVGFHNAQQSDFDNKPSNYGSRGGRNTGSDRMARGGDQTSGYNRPYGRGRGSNSRYEIACDTPDQRPRRGQDHSYRGQRPRQERDFRSRDKDHQEAYLTRTIQNSNIPSSVWPFSDAKTREEEKQELLSSVSAEIKKMNIHERESAARQQVKHTIDDRISDDNRARGHRQGRRFEQRGMDGAAREPAKIEKPHLGKEQSAVQTVPDGSRTEVQRKSSVVIQTTDAPEMLPPVTSIQTFSRSLERTGSEPMPDRPQTKGWAGGEFTPAWRLPSAPANKTETTNAASSGKPKRYSTLRQKAAGAEVTYTEPASADYQGIITGPASQPTQPMTAALPSRPLPAATYYDSSSSYAAAPSFHPNPGLALGMHQMAYQMQANAPPPGLYGNQPYMNNPQAGKAGTPIHNMYMQHSGSVLPPGSYMPMMNYPSHFPMAPVQLPPGAQPTHLHHGSIQDQESVEMHRMMYINQQGIPIPIMQQYVDQTTYMSEPSQVDLNEGYMGANELASPSQRTNEY